MLLEIQVDQIMKLMMKYWMDRPTVIVKRQQVHRGEAAGDCAPGRPDRWSGSTPRVIEEQRSI